MAICYYCMKLQLLRNPASRLCGKLRPSEICVSDSFEAEHEYCPVLCEWSVLRNMTMMEYEEYTKLGEKRMRDKI